MMRGEVRRGRYFARPQDATLYNHVAIKGYVQRDVILKGQGFLLGSEYSPRSHLLMSREEHRDE